MREIKFRVWWQNQMRHNAIVGNGQAMFIPKATGEYKQINLAECEAMQFTGLKDKNGKNIYEGDIVNSNYFKNAVVEFWRYGWHFASNFDTHHSFLTASHSFEVIGNIHENPELLNQNN